MLNRTYHILTMNYNEDVTGIKKSTYVSALRAEGVSIGPYVPAPIAEWRRLQWKDYAGPKVMWTETLRQNGIDYSLAEVPNCDVKLARSLEMGWNYVDVDEDKMNRMASAFEKVEANLDALRECEASQS